MGVDDNRSGAAQASVSPAEAESLATRAWVFGYPLVAMELTRRVRSNTTVHRNNLAPMGEIFFARSLPDDTARDSTPVAPNHDSLYLIARIDLADGPYRLDVPDMGGRYFMMPLTDAWMNVFAEIGSRATGNGPSRFLITGPAQHGLRSPDAVELRSPTSLVLLVGRIYASPDPRDLAEVRRLQNAITLTPVEVTGQRRATPQPTVDPDVDMATPVREQILGLDATEYFALLASLLRDNPPAPRDVAVVAELARIGIFAGDDFRPRELGDAVMAALRRAPALGRARIEQAAQLLGTTINGWTTLPDVGSYGTDYDRRAANALIGLGFRPDSGRALHSAAMTYWPRDAAYFVTENDADGRRLTGTCRYRLHFAPGRLPQADGYWAVSVFGSDWFFVPNPLRRYALGAHDELVRNPDGSVDLLLQTEPPDADRLANWLPVPGDEFELMIRIYGPTQQPTVFADGWFPPYVEMTASAVD
jgi:hypothetical protein